MRPLLRLRSNERMQVEAFDRSPLFRPKREPSINVPEARPAEKAER